MPNREEYTNVVRDIIRHNEPEKAMLLLLGAISVELRRLCDKLDNFHHERVGEVSSTSMRLKDETR